MCKVHHLFFYIIIFLTYLHLFFRTCSNKLSEKPMAWADRLVRDESINISGCFLSVANILKSAFFVTINAKCLGDNSL